MDPFDGVFQTEEQVQRDAAAAGYEDGLKESFGEGYVFGCRKGLEVGEELGRYGAYAAVLLAASKDKLSDRIQERLRRLQELVQRCTTLTPADDSLTDVLQEARMEFRTVAASMQHLRQIGPIVAKQVSSGSVDDPTARSHQLEHLNPVAPEEDW